MLLTVAASVSRPTCPAALPEDAHWWFHTRTEAIHGSLAALAPAAGLVLDVGGGAGNMVHHLSRYGSVIGVDNAWKPLQIARGRGYTSIPAEAGSLPFADDSFRLVALLDLIEHCENDMPVLEEAVRVCSPGGLLVITTPAFPWLWSHNDVLNRHHRRYTAGQLRALLQGAGLKVLRLFYTHSLIFPAALALLLLRKATGARPQLATPDDEDAYQVEMEPTPEPLNALLRAVGSMEAWLTRRVNLPIGTALLAIGRKAG